MNASLFLHTAAILYIQILWSPLCFRSFYLLLLTTVGCGDLSVTFHFFSGVICCASKPLVCDSPPPSPTCSCRPPLPTHTNTHTHHHHPVSELSAVRWLQYCSCRRGQFVQERDRVTGRDPRASAAPDPAPSGSLARKEPIGFWPRGPSTRPLLIVP